MAIGTATDPYQPAEGRFRLTRRSLDVLQYLSREAGRSVFFSITALDKGRWRKIEPGTPPLQKCLEVM